MLELNIKKKLNNFTLDIECKLESNRIGILGGSGAGKSMILKMLAGIEKPDKGYIKLDDRLLFDSEKKIDIKPKDRHIGYCFQNYALFPNLTVYENIVIGLSKSERADADKFLEKFELTKIKDSKPNKISGGQAARVAMARILIRKPKVLLFDEAFSALDIYLRDHIQEEIAQILEDFEGSAIFVSHSRDEVYRLCDSMMVIDTGKISNLGNTKEIFKFPKTKTAAILTGCKNISDIRYISDNTI
ncbi:MAG: sulfate/molybdate ABC transporter ATP-binding protein, partial [Lachnoanaerobaculum gingivalis]